MSTSNQEFDTAEVLLKLNAAKVIAIDKYPYMHAALFSMVPVCVPDLGTFASDVRWRLYYDPAWVMDLTPDEIAGLLMHEVGHCVRGHGERFAERGENPRYAGLFNNAGDVLINEDLRTDGLALPRGDKAGIYIENLVEQGFPVDVSMSAEQIYALMLENVQNDGCTCGSKDDNSSNDQGSANSGEGSDGESGNESGQGSDGESGGESGQGSGNGSGGESGQGSGNGSDSGRDPNCPLHGDHNPGEGNGNGSNGHGGGWDCGSSADGVRRNYEAEGDKIDPGVDEERADIVRRSIAKEIKEHVAARGTVPGSWERWAQEILEPVVDWRKEFASIVRRAYATVAGQRDYTYRRPSRRQTAMNQTGQGIILPAMRAPEPPKATLVFDTSGSMSDEMIGWSLAECKGILQGLGASGRSVRTVACDSAATAAQKVTRVENVNLSGGGGTDMRVGIESAMNVKDKPDVIVVLTDGYTPWPDQPIKGVTLIAALTTDGAKDEVPAWARTVLITRDT